MKKKIIISLVIIFLLTGCGKAPKLADGKEAIVSFDNEELNISADDLYNKLKDKYALNILIDMIDNTILVKEYPEDEDDAKADAKKQLDYVKENYVDENGKYNESALLDALNEYYGISEIEKFEELLVLSYYRNKAIEDYAKTQITDKEIETYYKNDIVGDISAKHILIAVDATDDMTEEEISKLEADALKKANNIIKELDKDTDFDTLAKEHSDDDGSAEKGGDLGFFNKGKMLAEFEKAAYDLKLNTYTKKPIKTIYGYHIILKTGEKDKEELKNIKDTIVETLSKNLLNTDNTLPVNAMIELRKSYGFNIEDSVISKQYSSYTSNQLLSLRNQANQE